MIIGTEILFEAAHRQLNDPSKCGRLHGHNWKLKLELASSTTNPIGYIVDFKDLKQLITDKFDHKVLLHTDDPLVDVLRNNNQLVEVFDNNPTCEHLAEVITAMICNKWCLDFLTVTLYENDKSYSSLFKQ